MCGSRNKTFGELLKEDPGLDSVPETHAARTNRETWTKNVVKQRTTQKNGPSQHGAGRPRPP